jgi:hypothetical protein
MDWIRENWLWLAFLAGFVWLHLRMHGGHDWIRGNWRWSCCGPSSDGHAHGGATMHQRRGDAQR